MKSKEKTAKEEMQLSASECGAQHTDCPSTWKGTCDRPAGHDGSHRCSQCQSMF